MTLGRIQTAALVGLALLAFGKTYSFEFVLDDAAIVTSNRFIQDPANLKRLFSPSCLTSYAELYESGFRDIGSGESTWRPLSTLSSFISYRLFGLNPRAWHAMNLLYHILAVLLFYAFARSVPSIKKAAWTAAALFAVHPVLSEAVSVVSYNEDLLCAVFVFSSLWSYLQFRAEGSLKYLLWMAASFALALGAKETAACLPALVLATEKCLLRDTKASRPLFRPVLAALAVTGIAFAAFSCYLFISKNGSLSQHPAWMALKDFGWPGQAMSLGRYFLWLLIPSRSYPVFPTGPGLWPDSALDPRVALGLASLAAALFAAIATYRRHPAITYFILWSLITLLPAMPLASRYFAARYLYLPAAGACLAMGSLAVRRDFFRALAATLGAAYLFFSWNAVEPWRNELTADLAAIRVDPDNRIIRTSLVRNLAQRGRGREALQHYRFLRHKHLPRPSEHVLMGEVLRSLKRDEDARHFFQAAIRRAPDRAEPWLSLGLLEGESGRFARSEVCFKKALAIRPSWVRAQYWLGVTLINSGKMAEGRRVWETIAREASGEEAKQAKIALLQLKRQV